MRVKRYVGRDVQEALGKIKKELGPEAVILRIKKLPWPGILNSFLRERAEVIAASGADISIGSLNMAGPLNTLSPVGSSGLLGPVGSSGLLGPVGSSVSAAPAATTAPGAPAATTATPTQAVAPEQARGGLAIGRVAASGPVAGGAAAEDLGVGSAADEPLSALRNELIEIKSAIKELNGRGLARPREGGAGGHKGLRSPRGKQLYQLLLDQGTDQEVAGFLVQAALKAEGGQAALKTEERKSPAKPSLEALLAEVIQGEILTSRLHSEIQGGCRTIVLVGPTGVGKTTTIAKLAARFGVIEKRKVSLVTADTYRVAAVDQLRTYAEIMGIELAVVHTPQEMRATVARFRESGSDLVLVDTAGRSPKKALEIGELKAMVDAARPAEVHLVLSIATRSRDLLDTVARFSPVGIDSMIFTKLDETSYLGGILNVMHAVKKPISYITTGQNVPDDIEAADEAALAKMVLAGGSNERPGWQLATNG